MCNLRLWKRLVRTKGNLMVLWTRLTRDLRLLTLLQLTLGILLRINLLILVPGTCLNVNFEWSLIKRELLVCSCRDCNGLVRRIIRLLLARVTISVCMLFLRTLPSTMTLLCRLNLVVLMTPSVLPSRILRFGIKVLTLMLGAVIMCTP